MSVETRGRPALAVAAPQIVRRIARAKNVAWPSAGFRPQTGSVAATPCAELTRGGVDLVSRLEPEAEVMEPGRRR